MQHGSSLYSWCRLIRDRRWSNRQKLELIVQCKQPEVVLNATPEALSDRFTGRPQSIRSKVCKRDLDADLSWLEHTSHHLISYFDPLYPTALKQLPDPPLALFATGELQLLQHPKVAIVGARRPTPAGSKIAAQIAGQLAELGIVVVSGMALGIDGVAHQAALRVAGPSIAVLGGGLDKIYPMRHAELFTRLSERGLVLSEYPLGFPANKYTFPERNRIVSGLTLGVIIVEAAERSGTLITARLAAEQDREVMVVPGSALSAQYRGSNRLIQQGAALVVNTQDVLQCLSSELSAYISQNQPVSQPAGPAPYSAECASLLGAIGSNPTSVDEIILASGLTAAQVSSMLITLELDGMIAADKDGRYVSLS